MYIVVALLPPPLHRLCATRQLLGSMLGSTRHDRNQCVDSFRGDPCELLALARSFPNATPFAAALLRHGAVVLHCPTADYGPQPTLAINHDRDGGYPCSLSSLIDPYNHLPSAVAADRILLCRSRRSGLPWLMPCRYPTDAVDRRRISHSQSVRVVLV
eukprot:COSAG01_NODE_3273_length_6320_cov_11.772062_2_plen_158_part_00